MIDWDRVAELRSEIGDAGFPEVVELFLEEVGEVLDALPGPDAPAELAAQLHFLKGSALNLGFGAFGALCAGGERRLRASPPRPPDLAELRDCYDRSRGKLLAGLGEALR